MRHFGLLCPPVDGHMNPIGTVGHELQQRGHQVSWLSVIDAKPRVESAGFSLGLLGKDEYPLGAVRKEAEELGRLRGASALLYTIGMLERQTSAILKDGPPVARELGIDALIVDQATPAGSSLADILDIPYVTVGSALYVYRDPHVPPYCMNWNYNTSWLCQLRNRVANQLMAIGVDSLRRSVNRIRRQHGLARIAHLEETFSPLAQISQQPPEFDFPKSRPIENLHYVGPLHGNASRRQVDFPFEQLDDRPLIYASMGTLQNQDRHVFHKIAEACMGLDAQLVISLGGGTFVEAVGKLPGDPITVTFAPQLELLKRARMMITHAGMNSALECLTHGVPMVAIPVTNDQPGVASRLEWTGAGRRVSLSKLSVDDLREAVSDVLTDESYLKAAQELQTACQSGGGPRRAAEIVETAVETRQPVLS